MIVVNLSELPWSAELRRSAAISRELVRIGHPFDEAIYVGRVGVLDRSTSLAARIRADRTNNRVTAVWSGGVRLWTYQPCMILPFSGRPVVERLQLERFRRVLDRVICGRPFCLWINCIEQQSFALAEVLAPHAACVVLDMADDWTTFADFDPVARDRRLARAIEMSDALVAVNDHVLSKFPHPRGRAFTNATDFDNFQKYDRDFVLGDVLPKRPGTKLVGFTGGLNLGRVDEVLVDRLIAELPDAKFVFVGYSNAPKLVERLRAHPRVSVYPAVPFSDLPHVIKAFDVAIIPHAINEHTRGNDLLKVLDYMASGVPVVSTNCSNVRKYGGAIQVADSHDEFIARVRAILDGAPHDRLPGLAVAREASWGRKVPGLASWLADLAAKES